MMENTATALETQIKEFCSELGNEPLLVQGAGGNVSWKDECTLWVKASGMWLVDSDSKEIFVADIVGSVDETVDATRCAGKGDCQGGEMCLTHELWTDLSDQIHSFLKGVDLASLVEKATTRRLVANKATSRGGQSSIKTVQVLD